MDKRNTTKILHNKTASEIKECFKQENLSNLQRICCYEKLHELVEQNKQFHASAKQF